MRKVPTAALAGALLVALGGGAAPTAALAGPSAAGYCPDGDGVTVVVDLGELDPGAPVVVRCAEGPVGDAYTGFDALADAAAEYEMPARQPGMVCRLLGRPAAGEPVPVAGDEDYTERCVEAPPTAAYWSYWHASEGGSWAYASAGPGNRTAIAGGFEGWSFSLNRTESTAEPPRIAPRNPNAPYDDSDSGDSGGSGGEPSTEPSSEPTTQPTTEPSTQPTTQPSSGPTPEQTGQPGPEPVGESSPEPTSQPSPEPTGPARSDHDPPSGDDRAGDRRDDPAAEPGPAGPDGGVAVTGEVPATSTAAARDSGPPASTLTGAALVVALLVLAAGIGWRRRAGRSP